ncbi:MAG: hypothetical protein KC619_14445 [Myxococcales bacterium]|nr:hypothetical protein [Myxococcales bacterium]
MARPAKKKTNRGSPEAIAKRRAARALNRLFSESGTKETLDGRSLKRKQRLLGELKEGKNGEALKALDVLGHATELFTLGETLASLRKLKPMLPPRPDSTGESARVLVEVQKLYSFDSRAWRLLGVDIGSLSAEAAPAKAEPRRPAKKRPAKKG